MIRVVLVQLRFGFLVAALLSTIGCTGSPPGPPRGSVSGKVTFDDQPLSEGVITFIPTGDTKGAPTGTTITNGAYDIDTERGPSVGTHRVEIVANRKTGKTLPAVPPATADINEVEQFLPTRYNTKSELTANIQSGSNSADFELKSD